MRKYEKNEVVTAEITQLNVLGFGVAKIDGAVFFVQNGVPGDVAEIRVIKAAARYYVARIERLITPSSFREEPLCPYYKQCGGCRFWGVSYELEKQVKREYVSECFRRAGLAIPVLPVLSDGKTTRYRNKAQFPVCRTDQGTGAGFYSERTHRVVPVQDCMIQAEITVKIKNFVTAFLSEKNIPPYNEETGEGLVRHVFIRTAQKTNTALCCLILKKDAFPFEKELAQRLAAAFPELVGLVFNINQKNTNVILGEKTRVVFGTPFLEDMLCEKTFRLSPASFYQVNRDMAEKLYNEAFALAKAENFDTLIDLYCGVGTIGQCAPGTHEIVGVEIVPCAVENARYNARINAIGQSEYLLADAESALEAVRGKITSRALLILDPPRKGIGEALCRKIISSDVRNLLYISCNPESLARDLAVFAKAGFSFSPARPVDLFPRTGHIETAVCLVRSDINS